MAYNHDRGSVPLHVREMTSLSNYMNTDKHGLHKSDKDKSSNSKSRNNKPEDAAENTMTVNEKNQRI